MAKEIVVVLDVDQEAFKQFVWEFNNKTVGMTEAIDSPRMTDLKEIPDNPETSEWDEWWPFLIGFGLANLFWVYGMICLALFS